MDFKNIADDIMKDIKVNEELKEKTLSKCLKKKYRPINKLMIAAALFLLIIGIANISYILPLKNQQNQDDTPENNIIMSVDGIESTPENSISNIPSEEEKNWVIDTLDSAKRDFGNNFSIPTYITQNYKLQEINAWGFDDGKANKIILSYFSGEKSFMITQDKTQIENEYVNYEKVDINGTVGLLNINKLVDSENEDSINTELYWSKNGIYYSIKGSIAQEEAIKIAKSMKI